MAQPSARRIALAALRRWRKQKRFADSIISEFLARADLTDSDRAFALELFYGVLRNLTLLDFWIGCLRTSQIEAELRDVLRLGLYQLFFLETAQHAAVYESVELVSRRQRAVINAMLRAAARQRSELLEHAMRRHLSVRTSHPQFLVDRWQQHFGAETRKSFADGTIFPPPIYGRINRLKIDREKFLRALSDAEAVGDAIPTLSNLTHCRRMPSAGAIATFKIRAPQSPASFLIPSPEKKSSTLALRPGEKPATSRS